MYISMYICTYMHLHHACKFMQIRHMPVCVYVHVYLEYVCIYIYNTYVHKINIYMYI